MKKKNIQIISYVILFIFVDLGMLLYLFMNSLEPIYIKNIVVNIVCLNLYVFMITDYINKHGFFIFDPIYFVSAVYIFMFHITPIYDIIVGELLWFGYDLFKYGVRATIIAFVGYFSFYLVYRYGKNLSIKIRKTETKREIYSSNEEKRDRIRNRLLVIYVMFAVALLANIYYLINSGYGNLTYILTLGLAGGGGTSEAVGNIGFISMLSYSLPTIVLLIWEYNSSKAIRILTFVPMFLLQVARGYRFFIIQILVTFIAYYCIRYKKKIKFSKAIIILALSTVFILLMTLFRDSIRGGNGINLSSLNGKAIKDGIEMAFWDNLRIYQNFYGMVNVIPSKFPFVGIRQLVVGTLVMFIPRAIWPGKISSYGGEGLRVLIGSNVASGQAYPSLGEYYYAFGTIGVILCMSIFALWLKKISAKKMYSKNPLDIIHFSVTLGCCLQLIIRGYFPSNFWYLIFALLPIYVIKYI